MDVRFQDPCIIFEPKTLYRAAVEEVVDGAFECEIGKADVLRSGNDVTLIGWGTQVHVLQEVANIAKEELNVSCEVIDLVSILPWDKETVCHVIAFSKTFRLIAYYSKLIENVVFFEFSRRKKLDELWWPTKHH